MNGGSSFGCFHICECCWCCWCCSRIQYICSIMMGEQHVFSTQNCVTDYYITVVPVQSRLLLLKEIRVFGKLQNRISSKMFGWFFLFVNFSLVFCWYFLRLKVTQFQMFQNALIAKCFPIYILLFFRITTLFFIVDFFTCWIDSLFGTMSEKGGKILVSFSQSPRWHPQMRCFLCPQP